MANLSSVRPLIVSFSGIDGAGKTTQIEGLRDRLESAGFRVCILAFWDDVATFKSLRETSAHRLFHSEPGVGTPASPVNRRDKNVRSWPLSVIRLFLYLADAVSLRRVAKSVNGDAADVLIFDRYLYDELANLSLDNGLVRAFVRLLLRSIPRPDIAYLLDVDPVQARIRKPEYPVDFLHINRASYLALSEIAGGITIVPPLAAEKVHQVVAEAALRLLRDHLNRSEAGGEEPAETEAVPTGK